MLLSDDHKKKTQLYHQNLGDFFFLEVCSFLFCISTDLSTFNLGKQGLDFFFSLVAPCLLVLPDLGRLFW